MEDIDMWAVIDIDTKEIIAMFKHKESAKVYSYNHNKYAGYKQYRYEWREV